MANYLKAATFDNNPDLVAALLAAKLSMTADQWGELRHDLHVDDDELTVWTEVENWKPLNRFWEFLENNIESDIEWSEIELAEYAEDVCVTHCTSSAVDNNVDFPSFEFDITFYAQPVDKFLAEQQGEVA
jgi:hypothetical protein